MRVLKKAWMGLLSLAVLSLTSAPAIAQERMAQSQGKYLGELFEIFILATTSLMFLASLFVILIAGWFMIRDYVMKDEREKRFTFPQLLVAMVVAGILGYPAAGYLLGQDLLTGADQAGTDVDAKDFKRPGQ